MDSSFQGVNRLFVIGFANGNNDPTRNGYRNYYLPRTDITKYNVLIDGRNFHDQPINDKIRQYDEIRKIETRKGDNYATGCLLDYKYFKDFYKLVAIDLSKQKELNADPRAIQQMEFYCRLSADAFVLFVLEKSKETVLDCKLKKAVKDGSELVLRLAIKNFNKDELPHELFLTTRQSTKLRNAINNNMSTDIKFSKAQLKKLIQSGGFLGKLLSKIAGPLMKVAMPLAKNVFAPLLQCQQ